MAGKDDKGADTPKKTSKLVVLLLAAVLVAVLGVGGVVAYVLTKKPAVDKKEDPKEVQAELQFIPVDPFTVNLKGNQERFAQIFISIAISDPKIAEPIKARQPILSDRILKLIAKRTPEELLTGEGKEKLAAEILASVKDALPEPMRKGVKEILFTKFIIQ